MLLACIPFPNPEGVVQLMTKLLRSPPLSFFSCRNGFHSPFLIYRKLYIRASVHVDINHQPLIKMQIPIQWFWNAA